MKRSMSVLTVLVFLLCAAAQEKPRERINVYLSGSCNDNATGAVVESSLRDSIRSFVLQIGNMLFLPGVLFAASTSSHTK